jgi:DNA-binding Lrp family transcriptional regulator
MSSHPKLDRVDLRILCELQKNARIANVDLADAVCLSPSPCLARLKRLEQSGYLAGYGARIRLDKLGDTLTVFTEVTLADHRADDFARFEAGIRPIEEIIACHLISGGYDYLLKSITRGIGHYQELIEGLLARGLGIEQYVSQIVTGSPLIRTQAPIDRLFDHPT